MTKIQWKSNKNKSKSTNIFAIIIIMFQECKFSNELTLRKINANPLL